MTTNIIGLFIGVGTYFKTDGNVDHKISLYSPPNDAMLLSNEFQKHPMAKKIITLTDQGDTRPTRNQIFASLRNILQSATHDSHFVFSFAGHGATYGKDFILHPRDFDIRIPDISGVKLNEILEQLHPIKKNKLIICDCCRVNVEDFNFSEVFTGLPPLLVDEKTYIISSCSFGEMSYESLELENDGAGVFTYFFKKNLGVAISNINRSTSLYSLFDRARLKTSKYMADRYEIKQTPMIHGGDANDWILTGHPDYL
jgi:hypothetical protein